MLTPISTNSNVQVFVDNYFANHKNGYNHPESPKRILSIIDALKVNNIPSIGIDHSIVVDPKLIHEADYLGFLEKNVPLAKDYIELDEDTIAGKESLDVALAGLKIHTQGLDYTMDKRLPSFVFSRPPGHHARPNTSMGFCIFNNVAYIAKVAQQKYGLQKIAIIDWDIHHFNGTEEMFYSDPSVLTISLHAYPYWPEGYGQAEKTGEGAGAGYNMNIPMPPEAGDWQYIRAFENYILPKLEAFEPELILISAGFDAHYLERNSSLGVPSPMAISENAYSYMTHKLYQVAQKYSQGRMQILLEGGYYLPSLCSGSISVIETLNAGQILQYPNFTSGEKMDQDLYQSYQEDIKKANQHLS
jgi:acetoin utilization deacetylase AcuC-like enzyme